MDYIREIAEAMSADHAALMVGAGFSKNADKISSTDKYFRKWNELADIFYETLYGEKEEPGKEYNNPLRLAQEVEITVGRPKLEKILKIAIPDEEYGPSEVYTKLMELPWRDVFTTNYDTLLERAADKVSARRYNVVVNQEDLVNSNDAPRILKLHGSFPSQRPFIITEEDYRTYPTKFAAMVNTVQQALLENIFCMIGFSCEDPNFLNWIGWIHDNLGKSSSQKIYMISVEHISEVKQKVLFDKNIIVVDLEKLYPEKEIPERLLSFLERLKNLIEEKKRKNEWFSLEQIKVSEQDEFEEKTTKLKILNESYPGWIFLPWKMKGKVKYILDRIPEEVDFFGQKEKFDTISSDKQLEYMYEHVRFLNIVGHPITLQTVEKFWLALEKIDVGDKEKNKYKMQYVYLQLLRTFRELADWEKYDLCRARVEKTLLKYEEKQFLYSNEWWMTLYRFKDVNLTEMLDSWNLAQGDLYWPMIKSSMYALIGEIDRGEQILNEILPKIRRQLMKNNRDEYLCSLEESVVSLLNFIRQARWNRKVENCIQEGDIGWWETNKEYCSCLKAEEAEEDKALGTTMRTNYDLSITYTSYYGRNDTKIYYALEYLRFLEQTGHPFRIQLVTNTSGFQNVVRTLYLYYPHWCLIQMITAQNVKELDLLFGRNKLSGMSQSEVDEHAQEYLAILKTVSKNLNPENAYWTKSIYDSAAQVLPEIIARLCYKCSLKMLDQILDYMLILCNSNVRDNFEGINKILKGLCNAYTEEEQHERIEKILKFPIKPNERHTYYNPVNYLKFPKEKYEIDQKSYNNTIFQIRQLIDNGEDQEKKDALQCLISLAQLICLGENDAEYLYHQLEEKHNHKYWNSLYYINKERYISNVDAILKNTLQSMEGDGSPKYFSRHSGLPYEELVDVLPEFQADAIEYESLFSVMTKLVKANIHWKNDSSAVFQIELRSRQSYRIAVRSLLLRIKEQKRLIIPEERKAIEDYFEILQKYYCDSNVPQFIGKVLLGILENEFKINDKSKVYMKMEENLWLCSEDDIKLLRFFYSDYSEMGYDIKKIEKLNDFSKMVYQMVVYKIINTEVDSIRPALQLLYELIGNGINTEEETKRLFINLPRLMEETTIRTEDLEGKALHKLNCRREICIIAREFYKKGKRDKNIVEWKELTQNPNEFVEIRNIKF